MTFVNGLYKEIQTVSEDTVVVVTSPAYFSDLEKIINETEKRYSDLFLMNETCLPDCDG